MGGVASKATCATRVEQIMRKDVDRPLVTNRGQAVRTTEVSLCGENDLAARLTDMRTWLDMHRYEPSTFTYFFLDPGLMIRVTFNIDGEAEAFAQRFGGFLLDNTKTTGHLMAI
jgi:hypothetical protein